MFWGLIMEPNKRYTQTVEKPFHISQAAMDTSTGDNESCQVMVVVDGKNFLVCTLQKGKTIQVPLDLYFKKDDVISFLTNGKCNIHLTGYLDSEFGEDDEEEEAEDEEIPELVQAAKRKLESAAVSKNKKPKHETKKEKKKEAKSEESEEDEDSDEEEQLGKLLEGDLDSDDNDESFKINSTAEGDDDSEESEAEEEAGDESEEEESSKKSADSSMDTTTDSKHDDSKLTKSQKKRLKKKQKMMQKKQEEQGEKAVNGVDKPKKGKEAKQEKTQKQADGKVKEVKEKKSLTGGVMIEDLKVGTGPQAKAGKVVQVYYEGRLKQNNKMFDSCQKGPGFKFRLGGKEVIAGWDVGVAGMKVGGKRKIICPASMAYGAKGSPPVIPPNSTLVFEVELKTIK